MYIRNPGHMTKMATMPIYGKNPSKIFFSRTGGSISKEHMTKMATMPIYGKNPSKIFFSRTGGSISKEQHRWLKYYNVYINRDPVMTLTFFYGKVNIGRQCI